MSTLFRSSSSSSSSSSSAESIPPSASKLVANTLLKTSLTEFDELWNNYRQAIDQWITYESITSSSTTIISSSSSSSSSILLYNLGYALSLILEYIPHHPLQNHTYRQLLIRYIEQEDDEDDGVNSSSSLRLRLPFLLPILFRLSFSSSPVILQLILHKYTSSSNRHKDTDHDMDIPQRGIINDKDIVPLTTLPLSSEYTFMIECITNPLRSWLRTKTSIPNRNSTIIHTEDTTMFTVFMTLWFRFLSLMNTTTKVSVNYASRTLLISLQLLIRNTQKCIGNLDPIHETNHRFLFTSSDRNELPWYHTLVNQDKPESGKLPWILVFGSIVPLCMRTCVEDTTPERNGNRTVYFQDMVNVIYEISTRVTDTTDGTFCSPNKTHHDRSSLPLFTDRFAIVVAGCLLYLESPEDMYHIAQNLRKVYKESTTNVSVSASSSVKSPFPMYPLFGKDDTETVSSIYRIGADILEELSNSIACSEDYLPSVRTRTIRQMSHTNTTVTKFLSAVQYYLRWLDSAPYTTLPSVTSATGSSSTVTLLYHELSTYQCRSLSYMDNLFLDTLDDNTRTTMPTHSSSTDTFSSSTIYPLSSSVTKRSLSVADTHSRSTVQTTKIPKNESTKNIHTPKVNIHHTTLSQQRLQQRSLPASDIPSDVLQHIFEFIDNPLTLGIISRVCHSWCEESRISKLWLPHYVSRWTIINAFSSMTTDASTVTSVSTETTITNPTVCSSPERSMPTVSPLSKLATSPIPLKPTYLRCLCTNHTGIVTNKTKKVPSFGVTSSVVHHNYYIMFRTRILAEKQAIYLSHQKYLHQTQKVQFSFSPQRKNKRIITDKLIDQLNHHLDTKSLALPTSDSGNRKYTVTLPLTPTIPTLTSSPSLTLHDVLLHTLPRWTYRVCDVCTCSKLLETVEDSKEHLKLHHGLSK